MGKTEKSMFVTRSYLDRQLAEFRKSNGRVVRQNSALVRNLNQIIATRKHYLKNRLPFLKDKENYRENLTREIEKINRLKAQLEHIVGRIQLGEMKDAADKPTFLVKLTEVNWRRLVGLLESNHLKCIRPPEGKVPMYLNENEKHKLKAILKKRLSWNDDILKFKGDPNLN